MITLLAVSDGYKHFAEAIKEYEKRLAKNIHTVLLKPIAHTNKEYIKVKETLMIKEKLEKMKGNVVLLDERGKSLSTLAFAEYIESTRMNSGNIIFVIGGSYGVDLEVFADIPHTTLKISDFVVPHGLALLILIEQIYRAHEILKGSGYHHS